MMAESTPAWSVFQQIFPEPWDGFKHVYPRSATRYDDGLVEQMLGWGNPEKMGESAYRCLHGGPGKHLVAMSGKSSLCLRCAKVSVADWVNQVSRMLHAGVIYRHIVLTVPARLGTPFSQNAHVLRSAFLRGGGKGLEDVFPRVSGPALQGGYIVVVQTHGRNGQSPPPLHIIATSGGGERQASQWWHLAYIPSPLLRKQWQGYLLTMLRPRVKTPARHRLVDACDPRSREGCVTNGHKGDVPSRYQSLATSRAQYVVSPPRSLRRIDRDDGHRVTYPYRSHQRARVERETVEGYPFIGRMGQHGFPTGFQRVRDDGVQATKTFAQLTGLMQEALAQVQGLGKGALKIIAPMTSRARYPQRTGRDP